MTIYRLPVLMLVVALAVVGCATAGEQEETDAAPSEEVSLRVSGSGTALPLVEKLAEAYSQEHPETGFRFEPGTNSGGAIEGVLADNLDLAVANRPLTEGLCAPCHRHVHAAIPNKELELEYNTLEALKAHPDIGKFVEWIRRKPHGTTVARTRHRAG